MSLVAVIREFKTGDYVVTRPGAMTVTDGMVTEGVATIFTIEGCIQPSGGRHLQVFPEAKHVSGEYMCFTETAELLVGDIIDYKGQDWRLSMVKHCEEWGEEHWIGLMAKIEVNP